MTWIDELVAAEPARHLDPDQRGYGYMVYLNGGEIAAALRLVASLSGALILGGSGRRSARRAGGSAGSPVGRRPPAPGLGGSRSRSVPVRSPGRDPRVDPTSPAYAPADALLWQSREGMAAELFDGESRDQAWAEIAEPVIRESVVMDTKGLDAEVEVECRQRGCRVHAEGPLVRLEQTMLQVQLVPCAVGGVEGLSEDDGRFGLDYYCFYQADQVELGSFAEWYRDRHLRILENLRAAAGPPR